MFGQIYLVHRDNNVDSNHTLTHSSRQYDLDFYNQAEEKAVKYRISPNGKVLGGIIPHHLLAAPIIQAFFDGIEENFDTIILITPNHYNAGYDNIQVSYARWETPYGELNPNVEILDNISKDTAGHNENVFENEHAVYGTVAFIKKKFPSAKLVPITVKSTTTKEECDQLTEILRSLSEDVLVLVSADFSHYQTSNMADGFDKQSIEVITNFHLDKIYNLDSVKHVDTPASVYIISKLMKENTATPQLLVNTNSAKLVDIDNLDGTTSYITFYFVK